MKKNSNFNMIIFCLVCVSILPFTTLMYLLQKFTVFGLIALIVNILCIPVVIFCLIQEKRNQNKEDNNAT